jgi:EAL domain-containing protein (putative c-di-GMP-specific phosphodiesterase class I)
LRILQVLGCDEIQGYLISPPLPAAEIPQYYSRHHHA